MPTAAVLAGSYDPRIVALSILIAVFGSFAALDLAERVTATHDRARLYWLIGGSAAMGIGIWSMHYVGMLAFSLPVRVFYDWPTVMLSLLAGILSSALALFVVSRPRLGWIGASAASIALGGGIVILHYTGMAAMRLKAMCVYAPTLVALSVVLAVLFSSISLWLTFFFRDKPADHALRRIASALLMGAAVSAMHYTGMAAASFSRSGTVPDLSHAVEISALGAAGISTVTVMVLAVALLSSFANRLERKGVLLNELFEQAPQAVVLLNEDNRVVRVNGEFTRLFGYTPEEALGRHPSDLIVPADSPDEAQRYQDLAARKERVAAEGARRRKDGSRLFVAFVRVPVFLPDGRFENYEIYLDITARRQAEQERQRTLEQLRALAARLQSAREEERARVAREIHDELGQSLTAIKIDVASLIAELPSDQKPKPERAESILGLVDEAIHSVRRISTQLRPGILDDLGLVAAIEWAAEEFETRTGIKCRLELPPDDIAIDGDRATALFRILQETLTNVARHAGATEVNVRLARQNGILDLEIRDNGIGVSEERLSAGTSLGVLGMRERALLLGGELTIHGAQGKGTRVRVRIPEGDLTHPEQIE